MVAHADPVVVQHAGDAALLAEHVVSVQVAVEQHRGGRSEAACVSSTHTHHRCTSGMWRGAAKSPSRSRMAAVPACGVGALHHEVVPDPGRPPRPDRMAVLQGTAQLDRPVRERGRSLGDGVPAGVHRPLGQPADVYAGAGTPHHSSIQGVR